MKTESDTDKVIEMAKAHGFLRTRDILAQGIHHEHLRRLCSKGVLVKTGRGTYRLADEDSSEHSTLAAVAKRVPSAVICLMSALRFHEIGTQNPPDIWIALKQRMSAPRENELPIHVVWFSDASYSSGVDKHMLEGVTVHITNPAKTIVDCFKYRNKIGLDVALEALKDGLIKRNFTIAELWKYAKVCSVTSVMRPYLESME